MISTCGDMAEAPGLALVGLALVGLALVGLALAGLALACLARGTPRGALGGREAGRKGRSRRSAHEA